MTQPSRNPHATYTRIKNKEIRNNHRKPSTSGSSNNEESQPIAESPEVCAAIENLAQSRKLAKSPMTHNAKCLAVRKVKKMYPGNITKQIECINQSIENGWKGIFPLKETATGNSKNSAAEIDRLYVRKRTVLPDNVRDD